MCYNTRMMNNSHGYLIFGDKNKSILWAKEKASTILNISINTLGSYQDFSNEDYDSFGIDESRRLKERAFMRPLAGENKVFVISSHAFTVEAQNALLKLFEEPAKGTYFFIITQNLNNILPTLISRLVMVRLEDKSISNEEEDIATDFLSSNPAKRLLFINKIIEKKVKGEMDEFLNNLESMAVKKIEKKDKIFISTMENIHKSRKYIGSRGSSPKLVLEYLALSLPII